ncbi:MAG: hypothetical protein ACRDSH_22395 [Pseudonocardiaceae bacterium]
MVDRLLLALEAHIQPEVAASPMPTADDVAPLVKPGAVRPVLFGVGDLFHPGAHGDGSPSTSRHGSYAGRAFPLTAWFLLRGSSSITPPPRCERSLVPLWGSTPAARVAMPLDPRSPRLIRGQ